VPVGTQFGNGQVQFGFGGWDLGNVNVTIFEVDNESNVTGTFNPVTGTYSAMTAGDTFASYIFSDPYNADADPAMVPTGKLTGKDWPVGEPAGVKVVSTVDIANNPSFTGAGVPSGSFGRPLSCIMTTSYLEQTDDGSVTADFIEASSPKPTLCDSPFQTHKRFKVAALPDSASSDGTAGIDLVFKLDTTGVSEDPATNEQDVRRYTVLQKLNNYTDKRLKGFKIELGTGVGGAFQKLDTTNATLTNNLKLAIAGDAGTDFVGVPNNFWDADELAGFAAGLFGDATSGEHTELGFFSATPAGFAVTQPDLATIESSGALSANYTDLFGEWIPSTMVPKGVFFDHDSNPLTDAELMAWWDGEQWLYGQAENFAAVPLTVLQTWAQDARYSVGAIEDLLNLGLTYMVQVGDVAAIQPVLGGTDVTVRLLPILSDTPDAPATTGPDADAPTDLSDYVPVSSSSDNDGLFSAYDNTSLLATILGFLGLGALVARRKLSK
jgi:hypothetical protein